MQQGCGFGGHTSVTGYQTEHKGTESERTRSVKAGMRSVTTISVDSPRDCLIGLGGGRSAPLRCEVRRLLLLLPVERRGLKLGRHL